jgi:hypothetical protein
VAGKIDVQWGVGLLYFNGFITHPDTCSPANTLLVSPHELGAKPLKMIARIVSPNAKPISFRGSILASNRSIELATPKQGRM